MRKLLIKKISSILLLISFLITTNAVFAKDSENSNIYPYSYTIKYIVNSETTRDYSINATGQTSVLETSISGVVPEKEGYIFKGWSISGNEENLYKANDKIKLTDSITLYAVWRKNGDYKITYLDDKTEILPSHIANGNNMHISGIIPKKEGYVFVGWKVDNYTLAKPGQSITVNKDTELKAVWSTHKVQPATLCAFKATNNSIQFFWYTQNSIDGIELVINNMTDGKSTTMPLPKDTNKKTIEGLPYGHYEAYALIKTGEVTTKSNMITFFMGDYSDNLTLFINGTKYSDIHMFNSSGNIIGPLEKLTELIGGRFEYNPLASEIKILFGKDVATLTVDSNQYICNGQRGKMPYKLTVKDGTYYISVRSFFEMFNYQYAWEINTNTVYAYSSSRNNIQENIYYIKDEENKYLAYNGKNLYISAIKSDNCMWVISNVDKENNVYELYNLNDLYKPLEVMNSNYADAQSLRVCEKYSLDGYLWQITKTGNNKIKLSPYGAQEYSVNIKKLNIEKKVNELTLIPIN